MQALLQRTGFAVADTEQWLAAAPSTTGELAADREHYGQYWRLSAGLVARLPHRSARSADETAAAETIKAAARAARSRFLAAHLDLLYDALTERRTRFVRVEQLVYDAAMLAPELLPSRAEVAAEAELAQRDKEGAEIDQGLFISQLLAHPEHGLHLCHAMLLPREEALERLPDLLQQGAIDLGHASVERRGRASYVTMKNPQYLNAEDQNTIDAMETAVDLALLDPGTEIAVLRGGEINHPKYHGGRVFGTGINLTHLYYGRVPYIWYMQRELGFVNKFYRGLASEDALPDDVSGVTREKPWVAVVEAFAIGGHCQYLLTMDYVIAGSDAFLSLPARKEGIVPGAANLRLPRFVGDRLARQAVMYERRIDCASPEGRLICDEVVAPAEIEATIARVVDGLTSSGVVSAASNRRAFRVVQEPLDDFRRYCAVYAREQAHCHFSHALIANLERHWNAQNRKVKETQ